jgi:hypothetical protein
MSGRGSLSCKDGGCEVGDALRSVRSYSSTLYSNSGGVNGLTVLTQPYSRL